MFSEILVIIFFTDLSFALLNCTDKIKISKEGQEYKIKKLNGDLKKVICFEAESGHVDVMCRECFSERCFKMHHFCDCEKFHVYDGCNGTTGKDEVHCEDGRWTSKSSCLTVVWTSSDSKRQCRRCLLYGMSGFRDHGRTCCKDYKFWELCDFIRCIPGCCEYRRRHRYRTPTPQRKPSRRQPPRRPPPRRPPPRRPPVRKPKCEKDHLTQAKGNFSYYSSERSYDKNVDCTYDITLPDQNKKVKLIFKEVDLAKRDTENKCTDYIAVYDEMASWSTWRYKFCGKEFLNQHIISTNNKLRIKFVTDGNDEGNGNGFQAEYDSYQKPTVTHVTQKLTGVVIGTACGMVFLALTFLAICQSRRLTLLHFVRGHDDAQSTCETDAIEKKAPPSYNDVMASPEKYPLALDSKETDLLENDQPPSYGLVANLEPQQEGPQRSEPTNEMSREVEGVEIGHETDYETIDDQDDRMSKIERESDIRESDDGGGKVGENEAGDGIRRTSCATNIRDPDSRRQSCCEEKCRQEGDNTVSDVQPLNDVAVDVGVDSDASEDFSDVALASCKPNTTKSEADAMKESETVASPNNPQVITTDV